MRRKQIKLPLTPITEETFIRQGWRKHVANDSAPDMDFPMDGMIREEEEEEFNEETDKDLPYFFTLSLPKEDDPRFAPNLTSNVSDEHGLLKDLGLQPGQYFVELLDANGLGFCSSEEELEILYRALTKKELEK